MDLNGKCVLLGVSGGIAAYKMANVASALRKLGADVEVIMTKNATQFITPLTFETLTGHKCMVDTFDRDFKFEVTHISLAKKADVILVAPATANVIAKMAHGIADDMLTTVVLAAKCPKLVAPAMNTGTVSEIRSGKGWWFLNTGVPHYVEFTEELDGVDVKGLGRMIRHDTARFPQGTNVNFAEIAGEGEIRMRTYERGVENETLACGTGATAAAIITNYALQHETTKYRITVPGGELHVGFSHEPGTQTYTDIRLTGPARRVFKGVFETDNF